MFAWYTLGWFVVAWCRCLRRSRDLGAFVAPGAPFVHDGAIEARMVSALGAKSAGKVALYTVRGGQCFLPREQLEQRQLQDEWLALSRIFGFAEYSLGVLAHAELFTGAAGGVATDEHRNELYEFTDRKGRRLALRGDVTPQFMAMLRDQGEAAGGASPCGAVAPSQLSKWFTLADCWRYERPGHCRRRNHLQWTCDIVGVPGPEAEIELLTMLVTFFRKIGLTSEDVAIHLSHRDIVPAMLGVLGKSTSDSQWLHEFRKVLDKYRKVSQPEFEAMLALLGFTPAETAALLDLIANCRTLSSIEGVFPADAAFVKVLRRIVEGLERAKCADWITFDTSIVRGSDYYTGAVFECFDRSHPQSRALAGGGRYDNCLPDLRGDERQLSHAVGFGMGNVAIAELLRSRGRFAPWSLADVVVFTPPSGDEQSTSSGGDLQRVHDVIDGLRQSGLRVYHYYKSSKWQKALDFADRVGAPIFVHPDVGTSGVAYQVHRLADRSKVKLDGDDLERVVDHIRGQVAEHVELQKT
ncbi:HISTIDYL-TRNA SYNTHETASE, putative [Babesia bigemina]|uniref:histidine--tRNA ligase n=1 Tax=Babesia bigemina TaxID=5866 RepID=A0A061DEC6_BABBI|nr:HISTIDYL-TRNA SYNTHETASE, putative [Babesia bigemina]CDR97045.1 HISTIDYL-TRNA SYNTHETASE, putative [Babesia bigemina]|eukprot:XP_012769231.1 HISTIDYL-TRNA SYNTHETASE, putative [Babesia bigemina]